MAGVDLTKGIVRILKSDGSTAGTGFVVTQEGLIATCAHVVEMAGSTPNGTVRIFFHVAGEEGTATVEADSYRPSNKQDVAILRLEGALPQSVTPLLLGSAIGTEGHPIRTFGFLAQKPVEGLPAEGSVVGVTMEAESPVLVLDSKQITTGFSGAPVFDTQTQRVIGVVTSILVPDQFSHVQDVASATLSETLRAACPQLQISDVCPYRGLDAFTEADAAFFFGRARVVERLLRSLRREPRFLAVLGPSGSGKSSVVQAGLVPQLRQGGIPSSDRWEILLTRPVDLEQFSSQTLPGALEDLCKAVEDWLKPRPPSSHLVLIFDQFEELFVAGIPNATASAPPFVQQLAALLDSPLPLTVILTLRDDFYSHFVQQAPALVTWLERGLCNLPATLEREDLLAIVTEPAKSVGLRFEEGLAEAILGDALEATPDQETGERISRSSILPLLEFALSQLWERRQQGFLTHQAYTSIGGVTGSLVQWADQSLRMLDPARQSLVRRLFTDLIHLGNEAQGLPDSRLKRPLSALIRDEGEAQEIHQMVTQLADARLLVTSRDDQTGQETVEIVHDALLREWGRLQQWLKEDRRFLLWQQQIEDRAQSWIDTNPAQPVQRMEGRLLREEDLAEAEGWLKQRPADLSLAVQEFIRASREQEAQEKQRLEALLEEARQQREEAQRQRQVAVARQLAAQAELVRNQRADRLELSVLLAVEAMKRLNSAESYETLCHGTSLLRRLTASMSHEGAVHAAAFSPDGKYLATGCWQRSAHIWDTATGREVVHLPHKGPVETVLFSPDGSYLATASHEDGACLFEMLSGKFEKRILIDTRVTAVAFHPGGQYIATDSVDGTARLWEIETGREVFRIAHDRFVMAVAFSPDGCCLATGSYDGMVRLCEGSSGQEIAHLKHPYPVQAIVFHEDGLHLATASSDPLSDSPNLLEPQNYSARIWDVKTGREMARMRHEYIIRDLVFSPNGAYLATASQDKTARLWEAQSGREIARMVHEDQVFEAAFSPDGSLLATGSMDHTARLWSVPTGRELARLTHVGTVFAIAFHPDGDHLATANQDGSARLWNTQGTLISNLGNVRSVTFSPNGNYLAIADSNLYARLWDTAAKREVTHLEHVHPVVGVAFSPDGRYLATASSNLSISTDRSYELEEHTAWLWDLESRQAITRMRHAKPVPCVAFSPDGKYLASACYDDSVYLWEVPTGKEVNRFPHEERVLSLAFSPDGKLLVSGASARNALGVARVWDMSTGQMIAEIAHPRPVSALAYRPDGGYLATAGSNVSLYAAPLSENQGTPSRLRYDGAVWALAFSPDGRFLATGSGDQTARVWQVDTGQEVARAILRATIYSIAFSPDGNTLATGSQDGAVKLWAWKPADLMAEACSCLTRNLTQEEWSQYIGEEPYQKTCPGLP